MQQRYILCGFSCNNNCIHCFNTDHISALKGKGKPLDLRTEEVEKLILDACKKNADAITFTGGEPTIRPDFFRIIEFAKRQGVDVRLQTNGRAFSSKPFAKRLACIMPDQMAVALHHTRPEVHDMITRVSGSWAQTVRGIRNLSDAGIRNVSVKVVLSKFNFRVLPSMARMARGLGAREIIFTFPQGGGSAKKYWGLIAPRYSEVVPYLKKALRTPGISPATYDIPFCFMRGYEKRVCELHYVASWAGGDEITRIGPGYRKDMLKDVILETRCKPVACKGCMYFRVCIGVWEEYVRYYGPEEFVPCRGKALRTWEDLEKLLKASG